MMLDTEADRINKMNRRAEGLRTLVLERYRYIIVLGYWSSNVALL
jgi:hypothetical protein